MIFRQLLPLTLAFLFATGGLLPAQTVPWTIVESPNPSQSSNYLKGVDALASNDAWAVGNYFNPALSRTQNLALHWNGSAWTVTPTPNLTSPYSNLLKKVAALAWNDVWAVGGHGLSFTLHWDGTQWSQVPLPAINRTNFLDDIAAAAPNDIWLVGAMDAWNGGTQTLTLHWNGTNWTQVPSPNQPMPGGGFYSQGLDAVIAIAANDVWAVGYYRVGNTEHPLVEHWNGTQWSIVPAPDGPTGDGWLHGIAAAGPNDIWAVGEYNKQDFNSYARGLAMHWNGSAWSVSIPPQPSPFEVNPLNSVVARGPNDFYAAGEWEPESGLETFIVHWDGVNWTQVPSENPPGTGTGWNQLNDLARDPAGGLWTVGSGQASFGAHTFTLIERADPSGLPSPTPTPSASPSPTPVFTPVPSPTVAPTSTPAPSASPIITPSASPSPTPVFTPVPSPTGAPTGTPAPSASPVTTPSASPSATPVFTPVPSPTVAPTGTPAPSASPVTTPSASPSATPVFTPAPSPTVAPTSTPAPSASPVTTPSPTPTATPALPSSQLLNISTRSRMETGENVMIAGFIVTGNVPKRVYVRALGPSLASGGVNDSLADPILRLFASSGEQVASNNNWQDTQAAEIIQTGIPPAHELEAAIVTTLAPGSYTATMEGTNHLTGIGLIEVYDLHSTVTSELANISTRAVVQTQESVMIAGFILGGTSEPARVAIRALGPGLASAGINNPLANPTLELRDQNGGVLVTNDDWQDDSVQAAQILILGLAPSNDLESALVATLAPGPYTAIVAGQGGGTGVGLVEVYHVQ